MSDASDREAAVRRFYGPLAASEDAARRVGWESAAAHRLRLRAVVDALSPLDRLGSVLDAGCGEGALLAVLREAGFAGRYRGEDILPEMITRAATAGPGAEVVAADVLGPGPEADGVACSGTLNTLSAVAPQRHFEEGLTALWQRTRVVLVVDFAVADRHRGGGLGKVEVGGAIAAARRLTRSVRFREDLVPGEALLVLERDREASLSALLPEPIYALDRAELLLRAGEAAGAERCLAGQRGDRAAMLVALTQAARGQVRDAERALRRNPLSEAALELAALLRATRRGPQAKELLFELLASGGSTADEARMMLAAQLESEGAAEEAACLRVAVQDPWLRRSDER